MDHLGLDTDSLFQGASIAAVSPLAVGCSVCINGLEKGKELNGTWGSIIKLTENGRFGVSIPQPKRVVAVRAKNLFRHDLVDPFKTWPEELPMSYDRSDAWHEAAEHFESHCRDYSKFRRIRTISQFNMLELEVKESSVPGAGLGLFTTRDIPTGDIVTQYSGWVLPPEAKSWSLYSWNDDVGTIIGDPTVRDPCLGLSQLINDAANIDCNSLQSAQRLCSAIDIYKRASAAGENVTFKRDKEHGFLVAFAVRDIESGDELLTSYGANYWLGLLLKRTAWTQSLQLIRCFDGIELPAWSWYVPKLELCCTLGKAFFVLHGTETEATDEQAAAVLRAKIGASVGPGTNQECLVSVLSDENPSMQAELTKRGIQIC